MHRAGIAVAVALVVATAGCLGGIASGPSNAAPAVTDGAGTASNTIDVTASATLSAAPDRAVVSTSVVGVGDTAEAAAAAAATDADALRDALENLDAPVTIEDAGYSLGPEYDYGGDGRELVGYRAVQSFSVETTAVEDAGAVVDAVVAGGASRVDAVAFTLSEDARAELRADALADAVENGRADADVIANAAGVSIDALAGASTTNVAVTPTYRAFAEDSATAGTSFEPGDVTVTATVTVAYTYE